MTNHLICTRHDFHDDDNLGCPWCHCDEKDAIIETLKEECRLGYNALRDLAMKDSEFTRLENFCSGVQRELTEALNRESALIQKLWKIQLLDAERAALALAEPEKEEKP